MSKYTFSLDDLFYVLEESRETQADVVEIKMYVCYRSQCQENLVSLLRGSSNNNINIPIPFSTDT